MSLSIGVHNTLIDTVLDITKSGIPFEFRIQLPPPLRTGIDYGFRKNKNRRSIIRKGKKNCRLFAV